MVTKHQVDIYSAGCTVCEEAISLVKQVAGGNSDVTVHRMQDIETARCAKAFGITSLPAVVIDGKLAACCAGRGVDEAVLRVAGLGK
jgi:hypothetical protein